MGLRPYLTILRPANTLVAGFSALLGYLVATGTLTPDSLVLVPIVGFITAGGNVLNDYYDAAIDRINRPHRPIPAGLISRGRARTYAGLLFAAGLLFCLGTNAVCTAIAVGNTGLLLLYAGYLKKTTVWGNLTVSYLTGSIFLFGGALAGVDGLVRNLTLFSITLLATMSRELLKDGEDVEGDRAGGARTLPLRIGVRYTVRVAVGFAVLAVGASLYPYSPWWGTLYLAGILPVDALILYAPLRALGCSDGSCLRKKRSTTLLKAGMFAALGVFCLAALV